MAPSQPAIRRDRSNSTAAEETNEYWLELDRTYRIQTRFTHPICLERGRGVELWDVAGKRYLDFESGQICVNAGHCHPDYTAALQEQAAKLVQTGSSYIARTQVLFQKKLAEVSPRPFQKSFLACSGSESNEAAMRLAKAYTGRHEIVSFMGNYHGKTFGSWSATGFGTDGRAPYGPGAPGSLFLPTPFSYPVPGRSPHLAPDDGAVAACIDFCEAMLDASSSGRPAAFMVELVQSAAGVRVMPVRFLEWLRETAARRGALVIYDEAQTLGRLGHWWGFEHSGVAPDIVTSSKTLGGGVPLSVVMTSAEIADAAVERGWRQSSSHTGDPLLCAGGLANIEIVERENLLENIRRRGAQLARSIGEMGERFPVIGATRGVGLLIGLVLVSDRETGEPNEAATEAFTTACRERGLLTGWWKDNNLAGNVVRLMPPYTVTEAECAEALGIMEESLKAIGRLGLR